ncbi:MAG TPA: molecular chaperone TorD family protein [Vicinamibacteria bacterium]|nr:molecular chaperone TorD family protein [Vicinamibacteria bacterium]
MRAGSQRIDPRPMRADDDAVAAALGRAGLYRLLGSALGYPVADRLEEVARLSRGAAAAMAPLAEPLIRLAAAAEEADPATVAQEYVFLFDRQVRCAPYESAYVEAGGMAGKAAALADIGGFYAAFGLRPAEGQPDMEDHVAAECEFMSALAVREAYALAEGHREGLEVTRHAGAAFLTDHLGRWGEAFADALRAATPLPYYAAVADVLAAWVRLEVKALGAEPRLAPGRSGADPIEDDEAFSCPMA